MSLESFSGIIKETLIKYSTKMGLVGFLEKRIKIVEGTEPGKIYIENVRSFFNLPQKSAEFICDYGVAIGMFKKKFAFTCPNCDSIIETTSNIGSVNHQIKCENCLMQELDDFQFDPSQLTPKQYYLLVENNG